VGWLYSLEKRIFSLHGKNSWEWEVVKERNNPFNIETASRVLTKKQESFSKSFSSLISKKKLDIVYRCINDKKQETDNKKYNNVYILKTRSRLKIIQKEKNRKKHNKNKSKTVNVYKFCLNRKSTRRKQYAFFFSNWNFNIFDSIKSFNTEAEWSHRKILKITMFRCTIQSCLAKWVLR